MFSHQFKIILIFFISVSVLVGYFLTEIRQISPLLDEIYFQNFLEALLRCLHTNSKYFWISCMSVSLLVCYFLTEIRQIWRYRHFWMRYFSEIFLRHSWDIGSLFIIILGWAYILTFEFLCAGLNFETSDLVTFWLSGGQLLRPSGLVLSFFDLFSGWAEDCPNLYCKWWCRDMKVADRRSRRVGTNIFSRRCWAEWM